MFDFLKKKISGFTDKLKQAIAGKQEKAEGRGEKGSGETTPEKESGKAEQGQISAAAPEKQIPEIPEQKQETISPIEAPQKGAVGKTRGKKGGKKGKEKPAAETEKGKKEKPAQDAEKQTLQITPAEDGIKIGGEAKSALEKISEIKADDKREMKAKVGLAQKVFGFFGGKIKIGEAETKEFFEEFELSLLESDVQQDAAQAIVKELKQRLVGREISAKEDITGFLKEQVRESLQKIMETESVDMLALKAKPVKILFLGPNGAGKTTSIAKVASYLMEKGKTCILAAGDTFRAASIEQLETHARSVGVKVVKHKYGADPAAVAFDAVKAAEARGIDFVLIDTAGRQETNSNLIEELKKINRVVKPDLKVYVGEAYTGQALLQQATEFNKAVGIDGFILTKIDADTKGGTAISLLYSLKKPVIFVGTGQRYSDLLEFKPGFIIDRIV